jgi:predicted RNase H-like nuclease
MGSPARRLLNPITRCWDRPHTAMQGQTTDEAPAKRLTKTTHADESAALQQSAGIVNIEVYPTVAMPDILQWSGR